MDESNIKMDNIKQFSLAEMMWNYNNFKEMTS